MNATPFDPLVDAAGELAATIATVGALVADAVVPEDPVAVTVAVSVCPASVADGRICRRRRRRDLRPVAGPLIGVGRRARPGAGR